MYRMVVWMVVIKPLFSFRHYHHATVFSVNSFTFHVQYLFFCTAESMFIQDIVI